MTFRLLRRHEGFDPGSSEQQPVGRVQVDSCRRNINKKIFAFFVLYRDVLISTSRRDARLTWMLYRDVRISTSRRDARLTWMLYRDVRMSRET
ncbi:MAG: hypothetical protein A2637_00205 [Candidatus Muproteobacteria bacterium RIFCSPHIGHO2_01_FULL_65_16]|uniref:Uncharacterized protein n=1 Tax=Candidatus Muproteobacteria bacterium RIFCSPHIGHO2_01_FULL_65_16 TaxID=1817764 RepID=A0A1F6TPY0_9PROT|nr:MAG: hypothetical protein A2637_00205 [Candidatus Muproteobacteria bacterium RIFCSPHIGHO2_01_FULL_65_16]